AGADDERQDGCDAEAASSGEAEADHGDSPGRPLAMMGHPVRTDRGTHPGEEQPLGREDDRRGEGRMSDQPSEAEHAARLAHRPGPSQAVGAMGEDATGCASPTCPSLDETGRRPHDAPAEPGAARAPDAPASTEAHRERRDRAPRRDAGAGPARAVRRALVPIAPIPAGRAGGPDRTSTGGSCVDDASDAAPDDHARLPVPAPRPPERL